MKKSTKTWLWILAGAAAGYYIIEKKAAAASSSSDVTGGVYAGAKTPAPAPTPPTVASGSPQDPNYDPTGGVYAGAAPVDPTGGVYQNAALEGYISPTSRRLR